MKMLTKVPILLFTVVALLACSGSDSDPIWDAPSSSKPSKDAAPDTNLPDASTPDVNVPDVDCSPQSILEFCTANGASCGDFAGFDNCGSKRVTNCGSCGAGLMCSGNKCQTPPPGCVPEKDDAFCKRLGKNCGDVPAPGLIDNCGVLRATNCGPKNGGITCGKGSACISNVCTVCVPETDDAYCKRVAKNCGVVPGPDNCGTQRAPNCGVCKADSQCLDGACSVIVQPFHHAGGPVMLGAPTVHVIWYGDWLNNTAKTIIPAFLKNLSGSPYFMINSEYYNDANTHVSGSFVFGQEVTDAYSQGKTLTPVSVQDVVNKALTSAALPTDVNALYVVLSSADVAEVGAGLTFCLNACGWHNYGVVNGADVKFMWVGDSSTQCPLGCAAGNPGVSPNDNVGADGMVSVIAHELEEAITDPHLNSWFASNGYENADMCSWKFLTTYPVANGSIANMKLGGKDYLIQSNWKLSNGGMCALSL